MGDQLLPLSLTERSVHLCVDMQRIFSAGGSDLHLFSAASCLKFHRGQLDQVAAALTAL
jgi:hypothetical protein